MEIWKKLRELRESKGLTYKALSKDVDISEPTLKSYESKSEKNRRPISKRNVIILSEYYGVSKEYLLYEDVINKTSENININEKLGFSDKTISIIKNNEYKTSFNNFLESISIPVISTHLNYIERYNEIVFICTMLLKLDSKEITKDVFLEEVSKHTISDINDLFLDIGDITSNLEDIIKRIKCNEEYDIIEIGGYLMKLTQYIGYRKYEISYLITLGLDSKTIFK